MISPITINPPVRAYQEVTISAKELPIDGFPILSLDRDSYIVSAEIHSGIDRRMEGQWHHIAIGKGCALADGITIMIDQNHDYKAVIQTAYDFLKDTVIERRLPRKSAVIIQNDVWVGSCATIMAGVVLRNGCVVAAKSVVTKDVPPYAIVGGNPARILGYRFDEKTVQALQKIAYWDWSEEVQRSRRQDFALPVEAFVEKYLPISEDMPDKSGILREHREDRQVVLFPADVDSPFPVYPKVLEAYFEKDRPDLELLIYVPEELSNKEHVYALEEIFKKYEDRDSYVTLQTGVTLDEEILFQSADYYVTTRGKDTVHRTCLADRYGVKILYGTDLPHFPSEL